MKQIIKAIEDDRFGHESWIIIGNEQHKEYWWALIGDCGNLNFDPFEKVRFSLVPLEALDWKLKLKAKTFEELMKKIRVHISRVEDA